MNHKPCYGKCARCVWKRNGGCSEWNGWEGKCVTLDEIIGGGE